MQFHKAVIICSLAFQVKNGKAFPNLDTLKQCGGWEATFAASDIKSEMKSITCSMTSTPIWDSLRLRYEWEEEGVIFSCHHQGQGYTIPQLPLRSSTSHHIKRNNEVSGCSEQFLQLAVAVCHWPNWVRFPTVISAFAEILHTGIKTLNLALANLTFSHLQSSKYHKLIKCRIRPALGEKRHLSEGTYASHILDHWIQSRCQPRWPNMPRQPRFPGPIVTWPKPPPTLLSAPPPLPWLACIAHCWQVNELVISQPVSGALKGTSHLHQTPCSPTSTFTTFNRPYNTKTLFFQVSIVWSIAR